jgi:dolichol-phosphate mannosyltransferase
LANFWSAGFDYLHKRRITVNEENKNIDIVIPVFNEGKNIVQVLNAFNQQVITPIRVLLCYDFESDSTLQAIKSFSSSRFDVVPIKNKGKYAHGAVITGFDYSDASAVISYMADDDYNAGIIDTMVDKFYQGNDVVCASRFIQGGKMVGCRWQKAIPVRLVAFSLKHIANLPTHDPTNAFRLFSRRLLQRVKIESSQGFSYSLELTVKCHRLGWRIDEVPALWYERSEGTSRFKVFDWALAYLHWYFYAYATTYLKRKSI